MWHNKLHHYASHDRVDTSRNGRFGFDFLDNLRGQFCQSFCKSADKMPYFTNLLCAVKCPELYLPHSSTTPKTTTPISTPTLTPGTLTTMTTDIKEMCIVVCVY